MKMNLKSVSFLALSIFFGCGETPAPRKPECRANADCNDGRSCLSGYCVTPNAACVVDSDCAGYGKFSCLAVSCSAGTCSYQSTCVCASNGDCPGYNQYQCVAISCVENRCVAKNGCECSRSEECMDPDPCTEDYCARDGIKQFCVHYPKPLCGTDAGSSNDLAAAPVDLAVTPDLSSTPDLGTLPDLTISTDATVPPDLRGPADAAVIPDLAQKPECNGPQDCTNGPPCSVGICEVKNIEFSCRYIPQPCPPDSGVDDAGNVFDQSMVVDLATANDLTRPADDLKTATDLAETSDFSTTPDIGATPDLAPPDIAMPQDMAAPSDLAPSTDFVMPSDLTAASADLSIKRDLLQNPDFSADMARVGCNSPRPVIGPLNFAGGVDNFVSEHSGNANASVSRDPNRSQDGNGSLRLDCLPGANRQFYECMAKLLTNQFVAGRAYRLSFWAQGTNDPFADEEILQVIQDGPNWNVGGLTSVYFAAKNIWRYHEYGFTALPIPQPPYRLAFYNGEHGGTVWIDSLLVEECN